MKLRRLFFWCHLAAGVTTGVVILIMSATGVLLMYEKQLIEWSDRGSGARAGVRRRAPSARGADLEAAGPTAGRPGRPSPFARIRPRRPPWPSDQRTVYQDAVHGRVHRRTRHRRAPDHERAARLAPLAGDGRGGPSARQSDQRLVQLRFPVHRASGDVSLDPAKVELAKRSRGRVFQAGASGQGARLQLAQRHRHLVRRAARDRRGDRDADFVSPGPTRSSIASRARRRLPPAADPGRGGGPEQRRPLRAPRSSTTERLNALWMRAEQQVPDWRSINFRLPTSETARRLRHRSGERRATAASLDVDARHAPGLIWCGGKPSRSQSLGPPPSELDAVHAHRRALRTRGPDRSPDWFRPEGRVLVWTGLSLGAGDGSALGPGRQAHDEGPARPGDRGRLIQRRLKRAPNGRYGGFHEEGTTAERNTARVRS